MDITITLDPDEQHVLMAMTSVYRAHLITADAKGGDAAEVAQVMGPIANRITRRLLDAMYGLGQDPEEPEWLGDHHIYPAGVGR